MSVTRDELLGLLSIYTLQKLREDVADTRNALKLLKQRGKLAEPDVLKKARSELSRPVVMSQTIVTCLREILPPEDTVYAEFVMNCVKESAKAGGDELADGVAAGEAQTNLGDDDIETVSATAEDLKAVIESYKGGGGGKHE